MTKNTSFIGIYEDRTTVSDAIGVLHKAGYRATDISVLSSDNQGSKDFAHEKHTKGPAGAAAGAAVGALLGAALALVRFQSDPDHPVCRTAHSGWTGSCRFGRRGSRRCAGLDCGLVGGSACDPIRRQTVCGPGQAWRHPFICSLRQPGVV